METPEEEKTNYSTWQPANVRFEGEKALLNKHESVRRSVQKLQRKIDFVLCTQCPSHTKPPDVCCATVRSHLLLWDVGLYLSSHGALRQFVA